MSDHLIAEANRHAKALRKMSLPATQPTQRDIQWYIEECIDLRKQLDRECASKREHLRIACDEINKLKVQVGIYERENAALLEDIKTLCEIIDHANPSAWENGNTHPDGHGPDEGTVLMGRLYGPLWHKYVQPVIAARKEAQP